MLPTMPMTPSSCRRAAGSDSGGGVGGGAVITPGGKVLRGDEVAAEASPWQAETLGRKGDAFFKQHDNGAGGGSATTSELARTPCSDELQGDRVDGGKVGGGERPRVLYDPPFLLSPKGHPCPAILPVRPRVSATSHFLQGSASHFLHVSDAVAPPPSHSVSATHAQAS